MQYVFGVFLILHGLIHTSYLTRGPEPAGPVAWPFHLEQSWVLSGVGLAQTPVRALGTLLCVLSIVLLVAAGLSVMGLVIPLAWWRPLTIAATVASLLLLVLYWHPWLAVGALLNVVVLVALLWANRSPVAAPAF